VNWCNSREKLRQGIKVFLLLFFQKKKILLFLKKKKQKDFYFFAVAAAAGFAPAGIEMHRSLRGRIPVCAVQVSKVSAGLKRSGCAVACGSCMLEAAGARSLAPAGRGMLRPLRGMIPSLRADIVA
jgi:hypothetical protein